MAKNYSNHTAAGLGEARSVAVKQIAELRSEAEREQRAANAAADSWFDQDEAKEHADNANSARSRLTGWQSELAAIDTELAIRGASEKKTAKTAETKTDAARTDRLQAQTEVAREEAAAEEREPVIWNPLDWPELLSRYVGGGLASAVGLGEGQTLDERASALLGALLLAASVAGAGWLVLHGLEWVQGYSAANVQTFAPIVSRFA